MDVSACERAMILFDAARRRRKGSLKIIHLSPLEKQYSKKFKARKSLIGGLFDFTTYPNYHTVGSERIMPRHYY